MAAGLPGWIGDVEAGPVRYGLRAWLVAFVPSLLLLLVRVALGDATLRPREAPDAALVAWSAVAAPIVESALMLGAAWTLSRVLPGRPRTQAVAIAIVFALAHAPGGGLRQATAALWPLLVYAAAIVAWRAKSPSLALGVAAAVHAGYNASFLALAAAAHRMLPP